MRQRLSPRTITFVSMLGTTTASRRSMAAVAVRGTASSGRRGPELASLVTGNCGDGRLAGALVLSRDAVCGPALSVAGITALGGGPTVALGVGCNEFATVAGELPAGSLPRPGVSSAGWVVTEGIGPVATGCDAERSDGAAVESEGLMSAVRCGRGGAAVEAAGAGSGSRRRDATTDSGGAEELGAANVARALNGTSTRDNTLADALT